MNRGYTNKALEVDLGSKDVKVVDLNMEWAREFIGGKGLGAKILYEGLEPGVDPLGPENLLIFATGPLTSTRAPTSGRWAVVTKSPHTGIFLDCQVGGHFGAKLKMAGFDYIVVRGKSENPVYLHVENGECELLSAASLWGKGVFETTEILEESHPGSRVGSIGPAGENLVTYACISFDRYHQAGRGGAGAVMGSKNLKAVVVVGDRRVNCDDPDGFATTVRSLHTLIRDHPGMETRRELGTPMWVTRANSAGFLPTRNFSTGAFPDAESISARAMRERIVVRNTTCYGCPIACGKWSEVTAGKHEGVIVDGPEYETIALLGANCGIGSIEAIAHANALCDDLGLDTISTGNVIAFAMECYEEGLIGDDVVTNLEFGNEDAQLRLIQQIAHREGIGDLLSTSVRTVAERIGASTDRFAIHVKGLELPGVDPRGAWGMALAYATADRGGCHQRCWTPTAELSGTLPRFSTHGLAEFVKSTQDERASCFSLVLCDFAPFSVQHFTQLLNSATGFDMSESEYLAIGERIWNLTRLFNVREGIAREHDSLPDRLLTEPLPDGPARGRFVDAETLDDLLDDYYRFRGWDDNGIPTDEKLQELGLDA